MTIIVVEVPDRNGDAMKKARAFFDKPFLEKTVQECLNDGTINVGKVTVTHGSYMLDELSALSAAAGEPVPPCWALIELPDLPHDNVTMRLTLDNRFEFHAAGVEV